MKIIFLDIDGVLNYAQMTDNKQAWPDACSPACVELINGIIRHTGAKIVVSSSWRHYLSNQWLEGFLSAHGLDRMLLKHRHETHIIGKTPSKMTSNRGQEIAMYLGWYAEEFACGNHDEDWGEVESYVILDDDMNGAELHEGHFVQTDWETGLLFEHAAKAIEILGAVETESIP